MNSPTSGVGTSVHRRRIVLLVGEMAVGGAERVAATLANAWTSRGTEVWLVPTYLGSRTIKYALRDEVELAFLADRMESMPAGRRRWALHKAQALRNLVVELQPDVVVSFLSNVNALAILALAGLHVPLVISERTDPASGRELHWMLHITRRVLYQFATRLVVQTPSARDRYRERILRMPPTDVIPNPLSSELERMPVRADHPDRGGTIMAMGRLTPSKGFDILVRAFGREFANRPEWQLSIWGEGPLRESLDALIRDLGLTERVHLQGLTMEPWMALARGQIFALPSAYEGFPNAMLEAMALGVPVVAFDCPSGPRELSAGGSAAVVIALGDERALGSELLRLANDATARRALGSRAAAHARAAYSESSVLARWDETLDAAVLAHARRPTHLKGDRG
jgi:GalNAc-alpha-(1->4)-GalNAc-alpha-(1->3)-diNAcBac-PP-undecaprenol alpha-1,4-N-acetyl-D-galactosaminyltransferase